MATPKLKEGRSPLKSRARSRSRTRSRSRSRTRSRGRPPHSPSRASKSPSKTSKSPSKKSVSPTQENTPIRRSLRLCLKTDNQELSLEEKEIKILELKEPLMESKVVGKTKHYEFGGPIGAYFMMLLLPVTVYAINLTCTKGSCTIMKMPKIPWDLKSYFDLQATLIFVGWFAFQSILYMLPIGKVIEGQPLRNGKRLEYRCNGFFALLISLAAFGLAVYFKLPVTIVYDKFLQLITTGTIFCFLLSAFLYIKAKKAPRSLLAPGGNSGNFFYDFFLGHELNPRIGDFDLKFFCELRPGLIGWVMLNLVFISKACAEKGGPSLALVMVAAFQILYVADGLWFENAVLTTMDIIHDGFGFMLVFGDLVWVPFLYCLQTRFLMESGLSLPWYCLAGIGLLNLIGYYIFRGSNSQKNEYRKDPYNPTLAHLESIPTSKGKRLLVSGWWGLCRKPNYLGDIIMSVAWSLSCGFGNILPFFYPLYFTTLLIHRERRDSGQCHQKYGASWDRYCERVKYRIFPMIY